MWKKILKDILLKEIITSKIESEKLTDELVKEFGHGAYKEFVKNSIYQVDSKVCIG